MINTNTLVRKPTPEAWRQDIPAGQVSVLPLVKDLAAEHRPGWISYSNRLVDSPEVEIISGGLSEREVGGGALWRQGHLLHFAFDLSPAAMNETGQALLLNSIAYIAQFTEDRPIAKTPSAFGGKSVRSRQWAVGPFEGSGLKAERLEFLFTPATCAALHGLGQAAYTTWQRENMPYLTSDPDGKLMVDQAAKKLGIAFDQPEFFAKTIRELGDPAHEALARDLLDRHAPDGPRAGSSEAWTRWWQENRPYLFYSEGGGYRWHLDPLAKRRGIPSDQLRGPARATPPLKRAAS